MCGIVGVVMNGGSTRDDLVKPLSRLEYRGYDSCGYATTNGHFDKDVGKISHFMEHMGDSRFKIGVAHTRWTTHGGTTILNAHPHHNFDESIFVVHNGIIENCKDLRKHLENKGYKFITETDTEIIPHYFDYYVKRQGMSYLDVIKRFYQDIRGTYAVILIEKGNDTLYAFKKDSPLVLGIGDNFFMVTSDIYTFTDKTENAIFFEDYQSVVVTRQCYQFYDINNAKIQLPIIQVERQVEEENTEFPHFMLKEIYEQPQVAQRLFQSLRQEQSSIRDKFSNFIDQAKKVYIVACGTSYNAGMVGRSILLNQGMDVHCVIASEFDTISMIDPNDFVIAISQSGETMDVVTVLKQSKDHGARIGAITNTPYSTIERLSDVSMNILAGPEIAVASTKAFTNQVIALMAIASNFTTVYDLQTLPLRISDVIKHNEGFIQDIARIIATKEHVFFLGRRTSYPVAMEMALKLKEISYIHAEGMMAGELKHGSIALIDPEEQTPVFVLAPSGDEKMWSSVEEVKSRGAHTIVITDTPDSGDIYIPSNSPVEFAIGASVVGQLLSYYTACLLDRNIDQPRNLAKSVTVG